ncbi:hypothetical protein I9W82_004108 [Candida metapsilosis]|uniref:Protein transport protein SFT2 n=1 Tax=Candida metapsilosis TaxID=273372 RepID=A0A8H8DB66_9ASCO|nr:hypothetical protein I9W82_004108 [Candida metapsilosis]
MSFFKSFQKYTPLNQSSTSDGAPLPPPATQPGSSNTFQARLQRLNPFRSQSVYLEDEDNYVTSEPVFGASIILTLISSLSLKSTLLSIIFAAIQLVAALWYTVSYFPLGRQTLNLAGGVARGQVENWINS